MFFLNAYDLGGDVIGAVQVGAITTIQVSVSGENYHLQATTSTSATYISGPYDSSADALAALPAILTPIGTGGS